MNIGRYEVESARLGLTDFKENTQDLMTVDDIIQRHAMPYLLDPVLTQTDLANALTTLSWEWSTLLEGPPTNGVAVTGLDHGRYGGYTIPFNTVWADMQRLGHTTP